MADGTFVPEPRAAGAPDAYGTIVVVGGGCYGSYYVRQLGRAARAGAVHWGRLVVVDRDPRCRVAALLDGTPVPGDEPWPEGVAATRPELVVADWREFFAAYLGAAADDPAAHVRDAVVPSPLMPHLMFEWILARARARWPARRVAVEPLDFVPSVPWSRAAPDGTTYVSFATWECPINCIEPARCPHTREARDWSLPVAIARDAKQRPRGGNAMTGPLVFHCTHRAYGVGMIDVRDVVAADDAVRTAAGSSVAEVLVATTSHCHGAVNRIVIGA